MIGAMLCASVGAQAVWYTNEATFVSNINPVFYLEQFNNFAPGNPLNGTQTTWAAPGANGYGWTAAAAGGLFSLSGALSTNLADDPLTLTFTGNTVTAFGGTWGNTDFSGNLIPGTVTVNLSNGQTNTITFTGASQGFLGWVGNTAIASVVLSSDSGPGVNDWIKADNVYTGAQPVPEPATVAALGLGGLALLRRRRK